MTMEGEIFEVVFVWPDGREEVRYRRPAGTDDARRFAQEIDEMEARLAMTGEDCPYFYRWR